MKNKHTELTTQNIYSMEYRQIIVKAKNESGSWKFGQPQYNWNGEYNDMTAIVDEVGLATNINKETICQFTGLQDMENNRIFDNDILRTGDGSDEDPYKSWQVVWSKVIGQYRLKNINGPGELPIFPSNQRGVIINNAHNEGE